MNKIMNLGYDIDSKEILLNILINYNDKYELSARMLIKQILNKMKGKNIYELLEYIKDKKIQYLNFINRFEVIFGHIIENITEEYKNNEDIKNALYEILLELFEAYKGPEYIKKDSVYQNKFNKCIVELISIIAQLNNLSLKNEIFEKIKKFLEQIKNEVNIYSKYIPAFLFSTFKLLEKVRKYMIYSF